MNSTDQFEAIVSEHYELLFRFAMSLTRSESDAWDLTQQTFYVWATKGHQLRDVSKVKTWLYTTLHRTFLQARRRHIRFPHDDLEEVSEQIPSVSPEHADQADCAEVLLALAKVDEVYQAAVALFYLDDCSYRDIASILEAPIGTVTSRIARGSEQLRGILSSDGSLVSSSGNPGDSTLAATDVSTELRANALPPPRAHSQFAGRVPDGSYDEWDFGSTLLLDPSGNI
jgi:RNA polymerase sigma-70 factor (ECF subfamily)